MELNEKQKKENQAALAEYRRLQAEDPIKALSYWGQRPVELLHAEWAEGEQS